MYRKDFMSLLKEGKVLPSDVDDFVDEWRQTESLMSLKEHLGMTEEEYNEFVKDPNSLNKYKS